MKKKEKQDNKKQDKNSNINESSKEVSKKEIKETEQNKETKLFSNLSKEPTISKYKKRIFITIMLILIIGTLLTLGWILLKAKLLVDEDIIVKTDKTYISETLKYGQNTNITITSDIKTAIMCESQCTINLKKIDTGEIIKTNTEIIKNSRELKTTLDITANKLGYGQELYSYQISCTNMYSSICPAPDSRVEKNALISINYEPNELQLQAKGELEKTLTQTLTNLITTKTTLDQNEEYLKQTSLSNTSTLQETNDVLKKAENTYSKFIEDLNKEEIIDYINIQKRIAESNILSRTNTLLNQTQELNSEIKQAVQNHNEALEKVNRILNEKLLIDKIIQTTSINTLSNTTNISDLYLDIQKNTNIVIKELNDKNITSYKDIIIKLNTTLAQIESLKKQYSDVFYTTHTITKIKLDLIKTSICISESTSEDCRSFENATTNNLTLTNQINLNVESCKEIDTLMKDYLQTKSAQETKRETLSALELIEVDKEKTTIDYSIITQVIQNKYSNDSKLPDEINIIKERIKNKLINTYNATLPTQPDYYPENHNSTKASLSLPLDSDEEQRFIELAKLCVQNNSTIIFSNIYKEEIIIQPPIKVNSSEYKLKEIKPVCCAYNTCRICIENATSTKNPLLLIHGHSFYKKHTPDYSTNIFSSMQNKLEEDELYIPAAILTSDKQPYLLDKQEFGKNPVPIVAKGTYYYVALFDGTNYIPKISKSENIDTYAIRLKEVVDELKYITGRDKIDVIAHSMGGLVIIRYMQLFGEESIGKVILIGTPTKGIDNRMHSFCKLLGYEKECDDMQQNSTIIQTINDPNKKIKTQKIYTIIGIGCPMDNNELGDGIVTKESATIITANNYIINGTCPIADFPLHNDMLYPEKYPEAYDIIKEILTK